MKAMKCEMCGSNDFIKKDGLYECQYCHTKYTLEEAKKLIIEVKNDINVKNIGNIENYIKIAENAQKSNNKKEAENYCNKIIELAPENYKAWFIKGDAAGWQSTIGNLRCLEAINCFENAINFAPQEEKKEMIYMSTNDLKKILRSLGNLACNFYINNLNINTTLTIINIVNEIQNSIRIFSNFIKINFNEILLETGKKIDMTVMNAYQNKIYPDYIGYNKKPNKDQFKRFIEQTSETIILEDLAINCLKSGNAYDRIKIYKNEIMILEEKVKCCSWKEVYINDKYRWEIDDCLTENNKEIIINEIMKRYHKIKELNPNFQIPNRDTIKTKQGCYIATCIYGSYNCMEVWTLRRYRDFYLYETWYGRLFIKLYYFASPKIVKTFGQKRWFNKIFKKILDRKVKILKLNGFKSTPYEDRY